VSSTDERAPAYGLTRTGSMRHILRADANTTLCGRTATHIITPLGPTFADLGVHSQCQTLHDHGWGRGKP
jgi:hypothetical protein